LFHVLAPNFSNFFLAFVRPFQAEDKLTRLFNAQWTIVSRTRYGAGFEQRTTGLPNQAYGGGLQLDEPQRLFNIRKPWRFDSVRWIGSAHILVNAF
jgi:hypothetical protein